MTQTDVALCQTGKMYQASAISGPLFCGHQGQYGIRFLLGTSLPDAECLTATPVWSSSVGTDGSTIFVQVFHGCHESCRATYMQLNPTGCF